MRSNLQSLSFRFAILASGLAMFSLGCGGGGSGSPGGKGGSSGSTGSGGARADSGAGGAPADSGAGGTTDASPDHAGTGGGGGTDGGAGGTGGAALVPPWHAFLPLGMAAPGSVAANGTTLDLSPNHYDATYFGTTLSFANGSLNLTGVPSEFVVVPAKDNVPAVNVTGSYSVSAWVTLANVAGYRTVVCGEGVNIASFFLQKRGDTNAFAFTALAGDATSAANCIAPGPPTDGGPAQNPVIPVANVQYHLVATRDGTTGTQILYVNGVESGRNTCPAGFTDTGILGIGHGIFGANRVDNVQGAIAEVGVINRVLTPAEVTALYARGRIGMPPPDAGPDVPAATDAGDDGG